MSPINSSLDVVHVDYGKLLESQLERWRGGRSHARGIAEYISNCDDSYRRLRRFSGQSIEVEICSTKGRHIDSLIISDNAEGMSYEDLEGKFFRYFESGSGREAGEPVTGRFGTGGKAYAIMNFEHCWICSVKGGLECRAWFKWDPDRKQIIRKYSEGGYKNRRTDKPNGTKIELLNSHKVTQELVELVANLEKSPRIRHVIKNQQVKVWLRKRRQDTTFDLKLSEPMGVLREWSFEAPEELRVTDQERPTLKLRYFGKPLGDDNFIDLSDGISSVADVRVDKFDGRPFSKYFNGSLTLTKLRDSVAVKENRKGLEEGDDLTEIIEAFIKENVIKVVSEVEEEQRKKERERKLTASSEKMKELSKFLKKCDLNFRLELRELQKRAIVDHTELNATDDQEAGSHTIYRKPIEGEAVVDLIRGRWVITEGVSPGDGPGGKGNDRLPAFVPDPNGDDYAAVVGTRISKKAEPKKGKDGLKVLMSDDPSIPETERRVYGEFDDPVDDRDMIGRGVIWINANHPIIEEKRSKDEGDPVFLEIVANYVLLVVAQYHAQKQVEAEPEEGKSDPILLFRQKFFKFQRDLRHDTEVRYYEDSKDRNAQTGIISP